MWIFVFYVLIAFLGYSQPLQRECPNVDHALNDLDCFPRDTCSGISGSSRRLLRSDWQKFQEQNCACDDNCVTYGDCCSDYEQQHRKWTIPNDTFRCRMVRGIASFGLPIYVVDGCPETWADNTIRDRCETEVDPRKGLIENWFVSDENLVLYRNLYCALCHEKTNVTYWRVRVSCDQIVHMEGDLETPDFAQNLKKRIDEGICKFVYDTPEETNKRRFIRMCKPLVDKCAANWTADQCVRDLCEGEEGTPSYVYSESRVTTYKNKFCAMCNYADDVTCADTISDRLFNPIIGPVATAFYPLNIIFDLNPGSGPVAEYKIGVESGNLVNDTVRELKACPEQHVYDPFIGRCRFVMCRSGYVYKNGACSTYNELFGNATYLDNCMQIMLNQSEYMVLENGTLFVNASGLIHDLADYQITEEGSALVCTNLTQNFTDEYIEERRETIIKFSNAQGIVSVVGQVISIVALTLHIIVYSVFAKLRNLAGKCVLCLAASLLAAQFLFLVGVSTGSIDPEVHFGACAMVAVLTHLAFLCSFMWMNVMAFDICRTFAGSVHKSSVEGMKKRFVKYCVYVCVVPSLIVLSGVITDVTSITSSLRPAYGEKLCWFNNRKALFVFFALPVSLVIAANTILFIMTAVHICKVQEVAQMATKNHERRRYGVYVKLFIIMGVTWIFAFIATGTDSEVVWYLFLIFNTLQGAFIFISFVFTKQVVDMIREKFTKLRRAYGRSTSTEERTLSTFVSTNRKASSVSSTNYITANKVQ